MVSIESYELNYNIFLSEQELFSNLICYGSGIVNESVGLISINEAVKDTIMTYLGKVTAAIQKAWERFKEIVTRAVDVTFLKSIYKKINEVEDPGFTMIDYKTYNLDKLDTITLVPFNYEEMKQYLISQEIFLNKYYAEINSKSTGSTIAEQIENIVITSKGDIKCTKEILQKMYKFVSVDFKSKVSKIEQDLKTVNSSNKAIEQIIQSMPSEQVSKEAVLIYENYITEDDSVKFKDDEKKKSNTDLVKNVTVYMKACTDILSGKMKVLKDAYAQDMKCIKHFIKPEKDESGESKAEETDISSNNIKI